MKILGIIPARGGSKGIPGKNIRMLGEKPLIAYTIQQALHSSMLTKVIVSTDAIEIKKMAMQFGADVPFLRPQELASDAASSLSVVAHAIDFFESQGEYFDAICLLQPTSPFRESGFVDAAIAAFVSRKTDALVSVLPVPHEYNPHWIFESDEDGLLSIATGETEIIKRRQDLPKAFFRDGSVYLTKTATIKNGSLYGTTLSSIESNPDCYVNIDTMEDWRKAETILPTIINRL
ncbi:MAG: acylneuraminate cytidylyltransferase family protein [Flavobacterium sp.]|nr:acylneuraminate cytidylyltransferase family protein [Flavobacterium sp.]